MGTIQSGAHTRFYLKYHYVWIVKYRKNMLFRPEVDKTVKGLFIEITERYDLALETYGTDGNHVHLFVGGLPRYAPCRIAEIIKSLSAKGVFKLHPEVKQELWGGEFWGDGYYVGTVGNGQMTEDMVKKYIEDQGQQTKHRPLAETQLTLF